MLRLVGSVLVFLAALFFIRGYRTYKAREARQYCALLAFLSGLFRYVSTTGAAVDKYMEMTEGDELKEIGFFDAYRVSGSLNGAYLAVRSELLISEKADALISGCLSAFGSGYLDEELRSLRACITELEEMAKVAEDEGARSVRIVSSVAAAVAVGVIIMLL